MSQADGNVANATGAVFRADLNTQLAALWTQHSGNAAPSPTYAFQPWVDTSTSPATWRIRNSANNGWIAIGTLDATFAVSTSINALVPAQTGNSGSFLTTDGTSVSWGVVGTNPKFAIFGTSSTWTCPTGVTQALVSVVGGGGGGGGTNFTENGGSGGLGGVGIGVVSVTPSTIYTITVGAGGAGNNGAGGGSAGGTSSFGPQGGAVLITATGGSGGGYNNAVPGANGTCSSASANVRSNTNIYVTSIPYISGPANYRPNATSSTAAVTWTTSSSASPGSTGAGEITDGTSQYSNATGGYGGAVVIQYWGQ